jgi:hypothetical protein
MTSQLKTASIMPTLNATEPGTLCAHHDGTRRHPLGTVVFDDEPTTLSR